MARDDEPSSTRARLAQERDRRAAGEASFTYAGPEKSIGEAIRENSEALDRASDEALSLAAERIAKRDAAGGLYGPFMVPASERSHTPGSPPTAGCGCHLPGINGHDPRYCKDRARIIGTETPSPQPVMYRCGDPLCKFMTSDKDAIEQHVENQRAHPSLAAGLQQQIGAGGGQRTFTRFEVLTLLRGEMACSHATPQILRLITVFENME